MRPGREYCVAELAHHTVKSWRHAPVLLCIYVSGALGVQIFYLRPLILPKAWGVSSRRIPIMLLSSLTFVLLSFLSTQTVEAYTWAFDNPPSQCGPLSVSITDGTDGDPPFDLAIIPYGPTPLFSVEVRTVQTITFNTSTNLNFTLNYPAASQLVAVVSLLIQTQQSTSIDYGKIDERPKRICNRRNEHGVDRRGSCSRQCRML